MTTRPAPWRGQRAWRTALRVLLSGALLFVLLLRVDVAAVVSSLGGAFDAWALMALALLLPGVGSLLGVVRWRVLLAALGARARLHTLMGAVLVGAFFNQFLPSTIGGDVIRSWWAETELRSHLLGFTVVAVDRLMGFLGFCLVAGIAAALHPALVRQVPAFWTALALVAVIAAGAYLILGVRHEGGRSALTRLGRLRPVAERALEAYTALRAFRAKRLALACAVCISVAMQGVMIAQYFILSRALGIDITPSALAVLVPIVTMISLLPLTINGIGLREGALATLGAGVGLGTQDAVALAWLFLLFQFIWGLFGGVIYLLGRPLPDTTETPLPHPPPTAGVA